MQHHDSRHTPERSIAPTQSEIPRKYRPVIYAGIIGSVVIAISLIPELIRIAINEPLTLVGLLICAGGLYCAERVTNAIRRDLARRAGK